MRRRIEGVILIGGFSCWVWLTVITYIEEIPLGEEFFKRQRTAKSVIDKQCREVDRQRMLLQARESLRRDPKVEANEIMKRAKLEKSIRDNLIFFPGINQMWCLVPKAGSTSWSKVLIDRLNEPYLSLWVDPHSNLSLQVILKQNFGFIDRKSYLAALKSPEIKKVILVRHPFARILSAYRDKLSERKARTDGMFFFQTYGVRMNRSFRKDRKTNKKKEPTLDEFLDYLINTDTSEYDEHWRPISELCGLCHVRYDHIIHLEDLENEAKNHLTSLGFSEQTNFEKINALPSLPNWKTVLQNTSTAKKMKLLKKYKRDFQLLGYNIWDSETT